MNFQEWLKKQNYYVKFHTRFELRSISVGEKSPFYCVLKEDAPYNGTVDVYKDRTIECLRGDGKSLQEAFFDLIREIEAVGQECGTIGTTNRKTSVIPDRFSFTSIDFPSAPNNEVQLSDWIVIDGYYATRVVAGTDPNEVDNRVAFIEKTPRVCFRRFSAEDSNSWLSGPKGSGCGSDESAERLQAYGFDPDSRKWCDEMLRALGYSF